MHQKLSFSRHCKFRHYYDPKHTEQFVTKYLDGNKIRVPSCSAESPDLNPIENLLPDMKKNVRERNNFKLKELEAIVRKEWSNF